LHKLNTDFFDPAVTCNRFSARLSEWWALPEALHAWVSPGVVVTLELGAPFVLLLAPRLGVVLTLLLLLQFTGIGATALSLVLAVTALAWLDREDLDALEGREWLVALAGLPAFLASALLYRGPWSWPQYGLTHATFGALLAFATWRLLARGPGRPTSPFDGGRPVLVGLAVLWLANGLAPYTGLKFQYSFAMLSNLRVDDDRQNSLIFPDTLRIGPDPYVRVDRVTYLSARGRPLTGGAVHPGMYAPHELVRQRDIARTVDETLTFTGTWRGEPVTEADLDRLPPSPLFQKELTRGGPQECVH
ncbi:MAG: hypothetical protein KC656_15130, partial [Myxococcales bacterium]|nr:hypothetical protein [Myxococcales bacterium]